MLAAGNAARDRAHESQGEKDNHQGERNQGEQARKKYFKEAAHALSCLYDLKLKIFDPGKEINYEQGLSADRWQ
jgi:hypothetical protein